MRNQETRLRIIDKASSLLDQHGPLGVRPSLIALHLGVSPSLVSYHFPDPDLLCAYGAGRSLFKQVKKEQELSLKFDSSELDSESSQYDFLANWLEARLTWVEKNKQTASVLAFPSVYKSHVIEEWKSAEESIINTLIPRVLLVQKNSIAQSHLVAKNLHSLSFLGGEIKNLKNLLTELPKMTTL